MKPYIVNEKIDTATDIIEPVLLANIKSQKLYSETTSAQRDKLLSIICVQFNYNPKSILDITCANILLRCSVNYN